VVQGIWCRIRPRHALRLAKLAASRNRP